MDKKELELNSDRIEMALSEGGIKARITGGVVAPRSVQFTLEGTSEGKVKPLAGAIAAALGVPEAQVARQGGHLVLTVKRTDAQPVKLLSLLARTNMQNLPACTATLGLCDDGAPLLVRLSSKEVGHVLVTGPDGCGASSLLRTMAVSLALCNRPRDLKLVIVGRELGDLARLPHVLSYATDNGQADKVMGDLVQRLGRGDPAPRIVILIDGLTDIVPGGNLARLLNDGHAAGVHIVASGLQTSGSVTSSAGFGTLIHGKGDKVTSGDFEVMDNGKGEAVCFTAATVTPAEVGQVVARLTGQRDVIGQRPSALHRAAAVLAGAR